MGKEDTHSPDNPALYLRLEKSTHILRSIQHYLRLEGSTHILRSIQHYLRLERSTHAHTPVNPAFYLRLERSTHILWSIQHYQSNSTTGEKHTHSSQTTYTHTIYSWLERSTYKHKHKCSSQSSTVIKCTPCLQ